MTGKQRRATYASPRSPELEAEAFAEEEAMIAEQQALEARQRAGGEAVGLTGRATRHVRDGTMSAGAAASPDVAL